MDCPFCQKIAAGDAPLANEHAVAFPDLFPVAPGHLLVVSRRHVADPFDLEEVEWQSLWALVQETREGLRAEYQPDGFNVGFNEGACAGQTVPHAHVHVIPRHIDDTPDPRGGIRRVLA